jgi:hypothetical protein
MESKDIKSTIRDLHENLEKAGPIDPETRELLNQLDRDLHSLLEGGGREDREEEGLQDRLESLAADFDSRHPQLSAVLRELGVALARVGI